jgi:hypothetical protein
MRLIFKENAYATHQPVLIAMFSALDMRGKNVIELGVGNGSTELLHHLCYESGAYLVSADGDQAWIDMFTHRFRSPEHDFLTIPAENMEQSALAHVVHPEIVFIDQGSWDGRGRSIEYWAERAQYVVVHDSDLYHQHLVRFKHWKEYHVPMVCDLLPTVQTGIGPMSGPPTLVMSNFHECKFSPDWNADVYVERT